MDTTKQLYEEEATGWKRGTYEDIKHTFRAPVVNWVFRTIMANHPEFLRYAWSQLKPAFQTTAFAEFSVEHRDTLLSAVAADTELPTYRRPEIDVAPAEFRELRGQVATFDVVSARLSLLFELLDRSLHDRPVGTDPDTRRAAMDPMPEWFDRDRGRSVTMVDSGSVPDSLDDVVTDVKSRHGLDQLPSIHRCLAQWPSFLRAAWDDVGPVVDSDAFERGGEAAGHRVGEFVEALPYRPRLSPDALTSAGFGEDTIEDLQNVSETFSRGPPRAVIRTLPLYASLLDVAGKRALGVR